MRTPLLFIGLWCASAAADMLSLPPPVGCQLRQLAYHLEKFEGRDSDFSIPAYATPEWKAAHPDKIVKALILDTETTGLKSDHDSIIELGMRVVEINRDTGELIGVGESFDQLQDPGHPLDPKITALTHITDQRLAGQSIDWAKASELMENVDMVIAHNADFDRAFVEKKMPMARDKLWACSYRQINWRGKGFTNSKLPDLSHARGFYVDSHRAVEDVNATAYLLAKQDPTTEAPYFKELVDGAYTPSVRFEVRAGKKEKEALQFRGYTWSDDYRCWYKYIPTDKRAAEQKWLSDYFYHGPSRAKVTEIAPTERFRH